MIGKAFGRDWVKVTSMMVAAALAVMSAAAPAAPLPAGNAAAGGTLFKRCAACHAIGPGATNKIGPMLNGVVGRRAGTLPGYTYSAAMKKYGKVWTDATLAQFLATPMKTVPGTKMYYPGLPKPQDQADVIAYLKQAGGKK